MTGFDVFDRYDFVLFLLTGLIADAALILGAALWVLALVYVAGCTVGVVRHFNEIMGP